MQRRRNQIGRACIVDDEHRPSAFDAPELWEFVKRDDTVGRAAQARAIKTQDADLTVEALLHQIDGEIHIFRSFIECRTTILEPGETVIDDVVVHLGHHGDALHNLVFHVGMQHVPEPVLDAIANAAGEDEGDEQQREYVALL